jgi:hypothetical protein
VRVPWRLFVLSLFVWVSFLTCLCRLFFVPWYGFCMFNTALASCTIVQILPKYSFHSLLKVALCWSVWWRCPFRRWTNRAVGHSAELKGVENLLW